MTLWGYFLIMTKKELLFFDWWRIEEASQLIQNSVDVSFLCFCAGLSAATRQTWLSSLYVVVMTLPSVGRFSRRAFATACRSTALITRQRYFIWTTWSSGRTLEYMSRYRRLITDAGWILCESELLKTCRAPRRRRAKCNRGHMRYQCKGSWREECGHFSHSEPSCQSAYCVLVSDVTSCHCTPIPSGVEQPLPPLWLSLSSPHLLCLCFLQWCERNELCRRLQLRDLLVAPLQRLTRYPLLLRNMAKRCRMEDETKGLQSVAETVDTSICERTTPQLTPVKSTGTMTPTHWAGALLRG